MNTVTEIKATITRVERAHKLLQKLECGQLNRVPHDVFVTAMLAAADAWGYAVAEPALFYRDYASLYPQGDIDVIFQKAYSKTLPKMRFRYAMSMDYVPSAVGGRMVATKLHHVTAHENNVLREIHLTGSAANSNKFLARLLAATRLYHAVLNRQLATAKLAPARVKFNLKELTDSHKVFTFGTPKYTGGAVSGRWSWRDLASKMDHMDYVQAMENMSTGPWVPPKNYDEYVAALRAKRDFDKRYKEKVARLREMYDRAQSSYRSPWVGAAAIRFPNYGVTDNQVRYFCTGGRTYRRED